MKAKSPRRLSECSQPLSPLAGSRTKSPVKTPPSLRSAVSYPTTPANFDEDGECSKKMVNSWFLSLRNSSYKCTSSCCNLLDLQ